MFGLQVGGKAQEDKVGGGLFALEGEERKNMTFSWCSPYGASETKELNIRRL